MHVRIGLVVFLLGAGCLAGTAAVSKDGPQAQAADAVGQYRAFLAALPQEKTESIVAACERLVEDAGFVIPRDALRQRLVRWDAFIRTHPNVARSKQHRTPSCAGGCRLSGGRGDVNRTRAERGRGRGSAAFPRGVDFPCAGH